MVIVDANVILSLTVKMPATPLAVAVQRKDDDWAAPPLWESEYRRVILGMTRGGFLSHAGALAAHKLAAECITTMPASTSGVSRLAETFRLTADDAEYALLAEWLEIPCVSFDTDLIDTGLATHPKDF